MAGPYCRVEGATLARPYFSPTFCSTFSVGTQLFGFVNVEYLVGRLRCPSPGFRLVLLSSYPGRKPAVSNQRLLRKILVVRYLAANLPKANGVPDFVQVSQL